MARNEALRAARYLGRALWRQWNGYTALGIPATEAVG